MPRTMTRTIGYAPADITSRCQLGGAWATSTARKDRMFNNSPGTIAGRTKDADGTIE